MSPQSVMTFEDANKQASTCCVFSFLGIGIFLPTLVKGVSYETSLTVGAIIGIIAAGLILYSYHKN